jgi:hypothetical protein
MFLLLAANTNFAPQEEVENDSGDNPEEHAAVGEGGKRGRRCRKNFSDKVGTKPTPRLTATTSRFSREPSRPAVASERIPVAATMPKRTRAAPPRTLGGIAATIADTLGRTARHIMIIAAPAQTKRLRTPVMLTNAMFWT